MPDGVIYTPCGNRRSVVCPAGAETYRADTYQLIAAGLRGGKGIPDTVGTHPCIFATFSAPGFGPVHHRVERHGKALPCRPRRKPDICPHGVDLSCNQVHKEGERVLGTPLCLDCYDHDHQVIWNAFAGELWRRTSKHIRRKLERHAKKLGYLHHPTPRRPAPGLGHGLGHPTRHPPGAPARGREITDEAVAGYLAKYSTKATEATGHTSAKLTAATVDDHAGMATHVGRLIEACWRLGRPGVAKPPKEGKEPPYKKLRRWAHMLGFGGHFSTRSTAYSTTLRALREARITWRREHHRSAEHTDEETTLVVNSLSYAGTGWRTLGDALLANTAAAKAREHRLVAKEETQADAADPSV